MSEEVKCSFCSKIYSKKGIGTHIWRNHGEGINHNPNIGFEKGNRVSWSKGLTKETNEILKKRAEDLSRKIASGERIHPNKGRKLSKETIDKLKRNAGGLREGAGRGKKGWYNGYWCASSWELAYVIYNLEHNIGFQRNKKSFAYKYKGEVRKYYPDFIEGDRYIEIKGFETEMSRVKREAMKNEKYEMIIGNDMQKYLTYVINKYGSDFIKLYDTDK